MTVRLIKTGTRGSSSWPGEQSPTRGRIHLRRLYFVQESPCSRAADHTLGEVELGSVLINALVLTNPINSRLVG